MDTEEEMEQTHDLVVRLYLVRHGESVLNVEGKVAGQLESPLTELGQLQASALGRSGKIDPNKFWRFYTSDLERAHHTGQLILDGTTTDASASHKSDNQQCKFLLDTRLRELSKGPREGYPKAMTEEEAIEARISQNEKEEDFPVLETEKDGYKRFSQWLYEVVKDAHQDQTKQPSSNRRMVYSILCVAHSALIRAALIDLFSKEKLVNSSGVTFGADGRLLIPNTSLTILDIYPNLSHECWRRNEDEPSPMSELDSPSGSPGSSWRANLIELTWTGHYDIMANKKSS